MQELEARKSSVPSRYRVFKVAPRVLIDNGASNRHTVIEVNGRDRPGLLYQITLALTKLNLMIHSALIATYGERAVDVFYVQDALGSKITQEAKLKRIRQRLTEALSDTECQPAKPERKAPPARKPAKARPRRPATKKGGTSGGQAAE
jgi:[protein-PII] uridylyltransferase